MSNFNSRPFSEIASVGPCYPRDRRLAERGPLVYAACPGDFPADALQLALAVRNQIARKHPTSANELELVLKRWPAEKYPAGYSHVHVAVLYRSDEEWPKFVEAMRATAARHLAALHNPGHTVSLAFMARDFLRADEQPTPITEPLETFPGGNLLGVRMRTDLRALVPGRTPLDFARRFREAPRFAPTSTTFEVRGQIKATKAHGKFTSISIQGIRTDGAKPGLFSEAKVVFGEELRSAIGEAFNHPARRLLMRVRQTTASSTKAKPLVTYTLKSIRFELESSPESPAAL